MATVYIFNGTQSGTADGSYSDPYDLSNISSAETAAGVGGLVIFKDGNYTMSDHLTLGSVDNVNFQGESQTGVTITSSVTGGGGYQLRLGAGNYKGFTISDLKFVDTGGTTDNSGVDVITDVGERITIQNCVFLNLYANFFKVFGQATPDYNLAPGIPTGSDLTLQNCVIELANSGNVIAGLSPVLANVRNGSLEANLICTGCTIIQNGTTSQLFQNSSTQHTIKNNIFLSNDSALICANNLSNLPQTESNNLFYGWSDSVLVTDPSKNRLIADPKFIDPTNGDYRLRPNSPLIGGAQTLSEQSKLESQYPDGKWFDANAAAGGDGSWATPYDSLFDAIDSFSGVNTATVLVKEGDHPMYKGWDNSISGTPAQVHSKIEIIGINSNVRFTSENNINDYCQFFVGSASFDDTEFFYKNIDFHVNNTTSYINRGLLFNPIRNKISLHQCKITQSSTGELMCGTIFYQSGTDGDPAEIELIGLEYIAVNWRSANSDYSMIFGSGCKITAKNCTFFEPERSMLRTAHTSVKNHFLGKPHRSSIFENCIFRSDIEYAEGAYSTRQFFSPQLNFYSGTNSTLGLFKNCSISSKYGSFTDNANYDFRLYNFQENCSYEDPKFVNAALGSEDIRLQSSSPLIGGISGNSSEEKWIARATKENTTYAFFDPQATGTGDGSSLVNACTDLFEAIAAVDYGGYIFVADMNWTTTSLRITKPVQIQALNPGKAIWRVTVNQQNLQIQPTGYQLGINITSGGGDGEYTFSGASISGHTKNIDGYYTGDRIVFDGSSTTAQANDYYTVANHTFDGTTHSFTLNEPLNGAVSGSTTIWQEINSTGDSAIRDMVLIDFNTFSTSQGNGITFQPTSKNNTVAATTSYGKMVFERNKVLQTLDNSISGNNKTGLYFRNDHNSVLGTRFDVNGNCFSFRPYPSSSSVRFYPMNMGGTGHLSIADSENRFCHNNSVYVYNDTDTNADFGNGLGLGFNSIFVIDNQYGGVSTQGISTTFIDQNNYFYGLTGSDSVASQQLSINPFIDAVNGDFRIRPSSELIGKAR